MSEIDGGENHAEQDAAVVAAATHIFARLRRRWCVGRSTLTRFGGISTLQTRLVRDDEIFQFNDKTKSIDLTYGRASNKSCLSDVCCS